MLWPSSLWDLNLDRSSGPSCVDLGLLTGFAEDGIPYPMSLATILGTFGLGFLRPIQNSEVPSTEGLIEQSGIWSRVVGSDDLKLDRAGLVKPVVNRGCSPLYLSSSPGSGLGKGQHKDLISKQSLEFSFIRMGLARKWDLLSSKYTLLGWDGSYYLSPLRTAHASFPAYGLSGEVPFHHACRAGLEASYLLPISPPSFSWVDPMAARKGDLMLYSSDIFPTETRKLPSYPRSYSVNQKRKPTHLSAPIIDRCGFTKRLSTVHSC
ncbi:hypothetical protein FXO38_06334 [Capsicum annuum]|nr:hypothetical protein FXO38_06334 [Capsicum annuum]